MNITKMKDRLVAFFIAYCLVLFIALSIAFTYAEDKATKQGYANYENLLPREKRIEKLHVLENALLTGPKTSAEYFQLLAIWEELDITERVCIARSCSTREPKELALDGANLSVLLNKMLAKVEEIRIAEKGEKQFLIEQKKYAATEHKKFEMARVHADHTNAKNMMWCLYLGGMLLTLILHTLQKLEDNCNPLLEIISYKAWRRIMVWPWYVWRNEEVTLQEQIALAFRILSTVCMGGVSLMGAGVAKAMAQSNSPERENNPTTASLTIDNPKAPEWSGVLTSGVKTRYQGPYVAREFHSGAVMINSITVSHTKTGVFLGLWTSKALTNRYRGNFGDEVDLTFGWGRTVKGINLSFDFTAINGRPLKKVPAGDVGIASFRVGKTFQIGPSYSIEPAVTTRYSTPFKNGGLRKGWVFEAGATHAYRVCKWFNLIGLANVIKHTGPYGFQPGTHLYLEGGVQWKFGRWTFTSPSGEVMRPLTRSRDGQKPLGNIGARIAYAW